MLSIAYIICYVYKNIFSSTVQTLLIPMTPHQDKNIKLKNLNQIHNFKLLKCQSQLKDKLISISIHVHNQCFIFCLCPDHLV